MTTTRQQTDRAEAPRGMQRLSVALDLREVRDDGSLVGYGAVFGVMDAYGDIVTRGAFAASLAAHRAAGTMPAMLWQHDAREPVGVWSAMSEDDIGLRVDGRLVLDTTRGRDAWALLKARALNGLSIGFISKQWTYDRETDVRTLTEIDLWEVSLVTFPANGRARVSGVKHALDGIESLRDAERLLRDAGMSRSEAKGFVSTVMRLREERRDDAADVQRAMIAAQAAYLTIKL